MTKTDFTPAPLAATTSLAWSPTMTEAAGSPVIDATGMVGSLRAARLLNGFRGSPPVDREALLDVIQRISALVEAFPELVELELNPLVVLPNDQGAVAVDARMRLSPLR